VTFNASQSTADGGTIMNYTWNFDDGNTTTVTNPVITHVYTDEGDYNVTLTITDSESLTDTTWAVVPVRNYPVADFTWSPERPLVNDVVTLDASLSTPNGGTIMNYTWNFDDGNTTTVTNPVITHVYRTEATYDVSLTVADSEDLTDTCSKSVWVRKLPVAFFTYSPAAPLVGETVTFNASQSTADGGTIMNYTWNFDDGNTTTVTYAIITHVYMSFGTYDVTLTIADSEDLTDTFMDTIRILIHPVANFTFSPIDPIINETITFNASASDDPDRQIVNYTWDFDDGSPIITTSNSVITHNYTAPRIPPYNVTLTVTDDDGLTDTTWKLVTVYTRRAIHDIAVISVTPSATDVYVGWAIDITVVAKNEGNEVESFTVTVHCGTISLGTRTVPILFPGNSTTLTFTWNTAGVPTCRYYTISANAIITTAGVDHDDDPLDNTRVDGTVKVRIMGDINSDNKVGAADIIILGKSILKKPGEPGYNAYADLNRDGKIGAVDIITLGKHILEPCTP